MSEKRSIIISDSDSFLKDRSNIVCFYLGNQFSRFQELQQKFPHVKINQLDRLYHEKLDQIAESLTRESINVGSTMDRDVWCGSQLGSRSLTATEFGHNIALILSAHEIILSHIDKQLVFIVDSYPLGLMLSHFLKSQSVASKPFLRKSMVLFYLKIVVKPVANVSKFFFGTMHRIFLARRIPLKKINSAQRIFLFRSWIGPGNFQPNGTYQDRNFGDLISHLTSQGSSVVISPMLLSTRISWREILKLTGSCDTHFLFPEQKIGWVDVLRESSRSLREFFLNTKTFKVNGFDFSRLFNLMAKETACNLETMRLNLFEGLLRKLKIENLDIERLIFPMEGNTSEKIPLARFREFFPKGVSIGFQHTTWFKNQPSMKTIPKVAANEMLPDAIVASGQGYLTYLVDCGYPRDSLKLGNSYRFAYLKDASQKPRAKLEDYILVLPNYDTNQTQEGLFRLFKAIEGLSAKVVIKPHPSNDKNLLEKTVRELKTVNAVFSNESPATLLTRALCTVDFGASITALESMLVGCPVIRVACGSKAFLDAFWDKYPIPISYTVPELRGQLLKIIERKIPQECFSEAQDVVSRQYFEFNQSHESFFRL